LREGVLSLTRKKKSGTTVGLDIEAGSIAAAELRANGAVEVVGAAVAPLSPGAFHEGEVADADSLADSLKELFSEHKLSKQVRLGVGNQRVVVRTVRLPAIEDPKEMDAAVRFQAQEQISMPLDQAVLEHQVVGGVAGGEDGATPQVDVVVVAARREMIASFVEPVRRAGLEPVGVDLAAFGMIRALTESDAGVAESRSDPELSQEEAPTSDAVLYCNVGDVLNLAVARRRSCLFTRVSTSGLEQIAGRFAGSHDLSVEHATQWLTHVGLEMPTEQIEGDPQTISDARAALEEGVGALADELRLSLEYYGAQESAVPVGRIVFSGPGSAIPGLAETMAAGISLPISVSRPTALASYEESMAARLTLPYGLALDD
jgi:type IV pilus assembly protein PilM